MMAFGFLFAAAMLAVLIVYRKRLSGSGARKEFPRRAEAQPGKLKKVVSVAANRRRV